MAFNFQAIMETSFQVNSGAAQDPGTRNARPLQGGHAGSAPLVSRAQGMGEGWAGNPPGRQELTAPVPGALLQHPAALGVVPQQLFFELPECSGKLALLDEAAGFAEVVGGVHGKLIAGFNRRKWSNIKRILHSGALTAQNFSGPGAGFAGFQIPVRQLSGNQGRRSRTDALKNR
jgi:hypothetical protein